MILLRQTGNGIHRRIVDVDAFHQINLLWNLPQAWRCLLELPDYGKPRLFQIPVKTIGISCGGLLRKPAHLFFTYLRFVLQKAFFLIFYNLV